jgi:hypothetical protein
MQMVLSIPFFADAAMPIWMMEAGAGWPINGEVSNLQSPVSSIWMADTAGIIYAAQTQQRRLMPIS